MEKIKETPYHSYRIGSLPKGCKLCVKGEKLVLFVTGLCSRKCFYCPLSEKKKDKDVVYANEWDTGFSGKLTEKEIKIILKEARLCDALGAGITGGDPLCVIDRTIRLIERLKEEFGPGFHIHLYTTPEEASEEKLGKLFSAGLDEIRFHPLIWDDKDWGRIEFAKKYPWSVGVEIPVIPGYEEDTKKLLVFLDGKISFLNLNELEIADTPENKLLELGYTAVSDESNAVSGSQKMAFSLMEHVLEKKYSYRVHYCTCRLKDGVQMKQRIKKRADNVAEEFDKITDEGMLIRGALYLPGLKPGFGYRKKLAGLTAENRGKLVEKLEEKKKQLLEAGGFREDEIVVDDFKLRLLCSRRKAKKQKKKIKKQGLEPAIVEEYPTRDGLEVDVEFL